MKKSIFQIRMKADLILSGKINKQLIHHEQNEKTVLTMLAIAGAVLLWLLSYKGAPLEKVLKSIARIIVVFLLLTLINIRKKEERERVNKTR